MPTRWETSNRPLFVRTVWVNGLRHAILSTDDPLLQYKYRYTPSPNTSESSSVISGGLEECIVKLRLALNPTKEESVHGFQQYETKLPTVQTKFYYTETTEDLPSLVDEENPLSERVLQWLDLSGRRLPAEPEEVKRPEKRKPEVRRAYVTRRKEFPTRSLSVDIPALKTSRKAKKENAHTMEELPPKPPSPIPPIVQHFDTTRQRPTSAWPSTLNRPQLHIFMPPLDSEQRIRNCNDSDCESCTSDLT